MTQSWSRFHEWMKCVCVVTFDLELGQKMEYCFPEHIKLSDREQSDVCYMAFPDSNSTSKPEHDSRFFVRLSLKETRKKVKIRKRLKFIVGLIFVLKSFFQFFF